MSDGKIALSTVISELRSELRKAQIEGQGQLPRFLAKEAVVELQVGVTENTEGKGGVSFWVFTAEAGKKFETQSTQKITLTLTPKDADDGDFYTKGGAVLPTA